MASEPGAAAAASVSLSTAEHRPADHRQEHRDLSPLPLSLCEPFLERKEPEERLQEREKSGASSEASEELSLTLQDCPEANANANTELVLQESLPPADPDPVQAAVSPLSLPAALEAPEAPEGGLSLGQPNGPARACTDIYTQRSTDYSQRRSSGGAELSVEPSDSGAPQETEVNLELRPETESSPELKPGTHVRVSLDHVIEDALVVSFRVGNKVFSGVLMDLTHRFGPYGIPITVFPPRRESSRRHVQSTPHPPTEAPPPVEAPQLDPALTPLFHQGAPYPPPLFLRDSYHTSLPQPPPRRIKRSRRRYGNSEEPTCMLVRLRPRQVLCDRCKGAAGPRAQPVSSRRRCAPEPPEENLSAEVKRLRCDDRPPRPRREGLKGGGVASAAPRRLDHRENRDSSHRESRDPSHRESRDSAHSADRSRQQPSRVLTRRLNSAMTPPRIRLKPHRYRTESEEQVKTRPGTRPETRLRTRPGLRATAGPQRSKINNGKDAKVAAKTQSRTQAKAGSRPGSRLEIRSGSKTESKPGIKVEYRKETKTEPRIRPKADSEPALRKETKPRILKPVLRSIPVPKPEAEAPCRPEPRPELKTEPRPQLEAARSRRKQVFPRPNRDFDLDFMGWTGPDSDENRTEPGPQSSRAESPNSDQDLALEPSQLKLETKPEPEFEPQSTVFEPQTETQTMDSSPESDPPPSPDPRPELRPDLVLTESRASPTLVLRSRSRSSSLLDHQPPSPSGSSRSGSRTSVQSRSESKIKTESKTKPRSELENTNGSKPSESLKPDSGADSKPELRPDSSPDQSPEPSSNQSESQCSTRSKAEPKSDPKTAANEAKVSESLTVERPVPKADVKSDTRSVQSSTPVQSRSVQRLLGADGRRVAVGDIVWAKIAGFPWWPARVLQLSVCRRVDREGGGVKQEARVAWFGSRTTSLLPLSCTSPFLETFQTRFDRKRKGPYRRAIAEAATAAKQTPSAHANT